MHEGCYNDRNLDKILASQLQTVTLKGIEDHAE